jgi:hypothetical protein
MFAVRGFAYRSRTFHKYSTVTTSAKRVFVCHRNALAGDFARFIFTSIDHRSPSTCVAVRNRILSGANGVPTPLNSLSIRPARDCDRQAGSAMNLQRSPPTRRRVTPARMSISTPPATVRSTQHRIALTCTGTEASRTRYSSRQPVRTAAIAQ